MSAPPTRQGAVPGDASGASPGTDAEVLRRASGVELLGEIPGSGYRRAPSLARRGDGQVIQLTPLLQATLAAIDGRRSVAEVAEAVGTASGRLVRPDDVRQLVDASLRPLGLLVRADGEEPELRRSDPLIGLTLRRVVTDPAVTRRITAPFAALFTPFLVVPVVLAFVAVTAWVLFSQGLAAATAQAFGNPALFLSVVVITVLSAGFHEFGHAAAARYGGATPGAMGAGFYLFWPAFYTDVTDSYTLGRAGRVRTDLGGLYFNALVVLASFGVWWLTGWHAVLLLVATQILQMVRQLLPLLRFDGYHVLADLTGVPDLYQRIGPTLASLVPGRGGRPEAAALKTWARVVVIAWVLVVVPLMLGSLLLMVLALPRVLATAWAGLREQAAVMGAAFGNGDFLAVTARVLGIIALALPLLGLAYVVLRLVRQIGTAVWRRTEDRPVRRGLAVLLAVALVAGLGWSWWPDGDRYRPVRAWEGGTLLDVVPAAAGQGLAEGGRGTATTVWPADGGALPTEDRPALALVMVPAGTTDGGTADGGTGDGTDDGAADGAAGDGADAAPTWVFPFDRPLPPGEGDNQALAVNTRDGSIAYEVSFALVWADGDTALNRNEAVALANCTGCAAVSVAFQVVLLVGSVDVVVPQNLATAVNYNCVECVTYALATQLVLTLDGPLDADGQQALAEIWAELAEFGSQVPELPLSELRGRLTEFETRIAEVVTANGTPTAATDADGAGDGAGSTTGAEPSESGGPADPSSTAGSTSGPASTSGSSGSTSSGAGSSSAGSTSGSAEPTSTSAPARTSSPATSTAPAGTSTAGGSTAGGSTAGGSTAGGSTAAAPSGSAGSTSGG